VSQCKFAVGKLVQAGLEDIEANDTSMTRTQAANVWLQRVYRGNPHWLDLFNHIYTVINPMALEWDQGVSQETIASDATTHTNQLCRAVFGKGQAGAATGEDATTAGVDDASSSTGDQATVDNPTTEADTDTAAGTAPSEDSTQPSQQPAHQDLNEVELMEADDIATTCNADLATVTKDSSDGHGLTRWRYTPTSGGKQRVALASGEYHLGVVTESCGGLSNGIDVRRMHADVIDQMQSWGVKVTALTCASASKAPVDAPTNTSKNTCTLWNEKGHQSTTEVDYSPTPPHYVTNIGD